MLTTQAITGILKSNGLVSQKITKRENRTGYQVCKLNKNSIGVLVGTSDEIKINNVKKMIEAKGFEVFKPEWLIATDGFYVRRK